MANDQGQGPFEKITCAVLCLYSIDSRSMSDGSTVQVQCTNTVSVFLLVVPDSIQ